MLFWTTKGQGRHRIAYLDCMTYSPVLSSLLHEGQVHQMINYPDDGYIILFKQSLFDEYLRLHPHDEQKWII